MLILRTDPPALRLRELSMCVRPQGQQPVDDLVISNAVHEDFLQALGLRAARLLFTGGNKGMDHQVIVYTLPLAKFP